MGMDAPSNNTKRLKIAKQTDKTNLCLTRKVGQHCVLLFKDTYLLCTAIVESSEEEKFGCEFHWSPTSNINFSKSIQILNKGFQICLSKKRSIEIIIEPNSATLEDFKFHFHLPPEVRVDRWELAREKYPMLTKMIMDEQPDLLFS